MEKIEYGPMSMDHHINSLVEDGFKQFRIYIGADGVNWVAKGRSSPAVDWTQARASTPSEAVAALRAKVGTVTLS